MKLYSINLLGPRAVDSVAPDKVYPPAYRTVQNRQPVPEGSLQKRNGISAETIKAAASNLEVQLVSPIYLKGGSSDASISAVSNRSRAATSCELFQWARHDTEWRATEIANHNQEAGIYYVANALDSSVSPPVTELVTVKYAPDPEAISGTEPPIDDPCCYSIAETANGAFDITEFDGSRIDGTGDNVWTGNWKSARCCEYHLGKLWVGGLVEYDFLSAGVISDSDLYCAAIADATVTAVYTVENDTSATPADNTTISPGTVIKIDNEEMCVQKVENGSAVNDKLTVTRGANFTEASDHALKTSIKHFIQTKERPYRIRWSKTFDWKTSFDGLGAGSFESPGSSFIDVPVTGDNTVVGMRSFRGNLYVLTTSALFVVTGTTTAQFGLTRLFSTPSAIGTTFWASDRYLFWVDANGIHQFNGSQEVNLSDKEMPIAFKALNVEFYNIDATSALSGRLPTGFVNEKLKIYGVHFPYSVSESGIATGSFTSTTMEDSTKNWSFETSVSGEWIGATIEFVAGTGSGQSRTITNNNANTIYVGVGTPWSPVPDATTQYVITRSPLPPGRVTWLYNYERKTLTTYAYDYLTDVDDITYVSDYHDNGFIWCGTGNEPGKTEPAYGGKYFFEPISADPQDWGSKAITTILETGDINLAAEQGLSYEDAAILHRIDLYCVPDPDVDVTYQLDLTVDNVATTTQTVTVASGSDTQPTLAMMPLPELKTGSFFKFKLTEATNGARGDLRKVDIFYDIRAIRGAMR